MAPRVVVWAMPNQYYFPRTLLRAVRRAARRADIHEICYLVLGRGATVQRLARIANRAQDTVMNHELDSKDVRRILARERREGGLHLLGYLHTHILSRAFPSKSDIAGYRDGTLMFIYSEVFDELRAYRLVPRGKGFLDRPILIR